MEAILKLQKFDPEKLVELCRMHLTFTLDLDNDAFSHLLEKDNGKKKQRNYFSRFMKDKSISEVMPLNQETISHIYQIIEFLGREINISREGLFRKTGSLSRQHQLKTLLRLGENIDFSSELFTVHDCACVLKSFLAELQEPLLSEAHYTAHCQITDMCQDELSSSQKKYILEKQLKSTQLLLLLLPPDNYCLLKYLLLLLNQIHNAQEKNKMTSQNLATLFAPHIICPKKMPAEELKKNFRRMVKCITFLIENATTVFSPPVELVQDVNLYLQEMSYEGQLQFAEKELQRDNYMEMSREPQKKHFRSRSVGAAIKRHILKNSHKKKEDLDLRHSAYDMALPASKSTESIPKSKSFDALDLEAKESSRFSEMKKNFLRASRKKVHKIVKSE
ncbi:rho GTPase-activating protein 19 isoform X2 [Parasteatoda tepidariorum]|nr:rho GTPase-activating protein 19 isoform X2 [Parasteatoda tepidariorum]